MSPLPRQYLLMGRSATPPMTKQRHVEKFKEMVTSLKADSSTLITDNERLKRELCRLTTENATLRATTTFSVKGSDSNSSEFSGPTPSFDIAASQSLLSPDPTSLQTKRSTNDTAIDSESGSRHTALTLFNDLPIISPFPVVDSTAHIGSNMAKEQQQPLREAGHRSHSQSPTIDTMDAAFVGRTTDVRDFLPPTEKLSSSSVDDFNKASNPHPVGSCGSNRAESSKRKRENVEYIFDSRSVGHKDGEQQFKRGRRGCLSADSKERQKEVKDRGGACWRCRILKKPCDDQDTCLNCLSIKSEVCIWAEIGCMRGSPGDPFYRKKQDLGDLPILLQTQAGAFEDLLHLCSQEKSFSNAERIDATFDLIKVMRIMQLHISGAFSSKNLDSSVETIRLVACVSKDIINGAWLITSHGRRFLESCTEFSMAIGSCCSDYPKSCEDIELLLFARFTGDIMFILQDYLEDCVEEQDAAENSQKFDAAYQVAGRTALGLLADRLESFIFRKKRSDLRYFRTWFHILDLFHAGDGVWHKLFIASTQGVLNSSRTEHKKERDTVRERLIQLTSSFKAGSFAYTRELHFVAQVAGLAPYNPNGTRRTILKSSVLSDLPDTQLWLLLTPILISDQAALTALDAISSNDQARFHDITAQAAQSGNVTVLNAALKRGAEPKDFIIEALDNGSPEICACLFDAGLDINYRIPDYSGNTLTCASAFAKTPLIEFLLSRGADPNTENWGWGQLQFKPLAGAAVGCVKDADAAKAMEVLLNGGARWEGTGALQLAARKGRLECVKMLMKWGADVNEVVERMDGNNAVKLAELEGHEEIVGILKMNGAKE